MELQSGQTELLNQLLLSHFHLSREHQEREGQLKKESLRKGSEEQEQGAIDTDEQLQQHSDLLQKPVSSDQLEKGNRIESEELQAEAVQLFPFTKEPKHYKSILQLLTNKVSRELVLWKGRLVVLQKQKDHYLVRSAKPLDRLLKVQIDPQQERELVLVFVNKHQNQFCAPLIKKLWLKDRAGLVLHLQNSLTNEIARMQGREPGEVFSGKEPGEIFTIT